MLHCFAQDPGSESCFTIDFSFKQMAHFPLLHLGGDETVLFLSLTGIYKHKNTAKLTHLPGLRVTTNRNTWNYQLLMVKKTEYLSERVFEVCVLGFPPLFLIHAPVRSIQILFVQAFWGFSCSGCGVSPKVFAHFCHKSLKVHFKSHETPLDPPLTISIFKTELKGEMGRTIKTDIKTLFYIFHSE